MESVFWGRTHRTSFSGFLFLEVRRTGLAPQSSRRLGYLQTGERQVMTLHSCPSEEPLASGSAHPSPVERQERRGEIVGMAGPEGVARLGTRWAGPGDWRTIHTGEGNPSLSCPVERLQRLGLGIHCRFEQQADSSERPPSPRCQCSPGILQPRGQHAAVIQHCPAQSRLMHPPGW